MNHFYVSLLKERKETRKGNFFLTKANSKYERVMRGYFIIKI